MNCALNLDKCNSFVTSPKRLHRLWCPSSFLSNVYFPKCETDGHECLMLKVKESLYGPRQALGVSGVWRPVISRKSAHGSGKLSPEDTGHLTPQKYFWCSFCYKLNRLQGSSAAGSIMSMTLWGIEPTTFRLLVQCINQLRQPVPPCLMLRFRNSRDLTVLCHIYIHGLYRDNFTFPEVEKKSQLSSPTTRKSAPAHVTILQHNFLTNSIKIIILSYHLCLGTIWDFKINILGRT
jgi:hypothetical protein